jgi:hypothetical protein
MANINNAKGKFNLHRWEVIAKMNEFDLFRMCFPEQFVINVIIPQMHWVDDINKHRHSPILLESYRKTKWWANLQFTFLLSLAEVNAGMARARAKKALAEPVLNFWRNLAKMMLENRLNDRHQFKRVSTVYLARPCTVCRKDTLDYCSCDFPIDLCSACFGAHCA